MSESEPHNSPPPDGVDGEPAIGSAAIPSEQGDATIQDSSAAHGAEESATSAEPAPRHLLRGSGLLGLRTSVWAVIATICVAGGVFASVLGAHAVARTDTAKTPRAFPRASADLAATLKLAIQRQEELAVSASTFFAGNPDASAAQFDTWVKWAHTLRRYPELQRLGLVALVRAPEIAAFDARMAGHALKPQTPGRAPAAPAAIAVIPAGSRSFYCFSAAELARNPRARPPAGLDYCSVTPGLLASRDSGRSIYSSASYGHEHALAIETPVYRGNVLPRTLAGRRAAFVGWLRSLVVPGIVLKQALGGNPGYAVRLRHGTSSSHVVFAGGTHPAVAQSRTIELHDGWSVTSIGPTAARSGVLSDEHALTLLIGGILLSLLLGALVFVLGNGRRRDAAPQIRELPHSDLYDALTGLPNSALTLDRAERMVARAARQSGMLAGALLIDIDWFKDVNEKLGTAAGDQLLRTVARRLEGVIRAEDTVGRLGGDEFVVLVESAARGVRLDSLAGRIIEALHKPVPLEDFGPGFFATASIGVAFGRYETPEDLMRDAQLALYSAKAAGKDRYTLFNANMRSMIESRGVLEAELNAALENDEFFLLYEPIYDLGSQRVVGLEAIIRWQHPKRGVLAADDFIPLAEETGLIVPIGRWALEEACTRTAAWNVSGHRVGVSLKVSGGQLDRDGFETDVRRALQQSGIEPQLLTIEIPEASVMPDIAAAAKRIADAKKHGVRVAVDGFDGSGYARQADLEQLAVDVLRVDRSASSSSDDEAYRTWLLEAIVTVARDLSLTVVATGVETHEQIMSLQAMGYTMAQGAFMGEPAPANEIHNLMYRPMPAAPLSAAAPTGQIP